MIKDLLKLYEEETNIYLENKMNKKVSIRPSVIVIWVVTFFYFTSKIDLFPEAWVSPPILALIDDILIVGLSLWYTLVSQDVKELKNGKKLQRFYRIRNNPKGDIPDKKPANKTNSDDLPIGNSDLSTDTDCDEILVDNTANDTNPYRCVPTNSNFNFNDDPEANNERVWDERNFRD